MTNASDTLRNAQAGSDLAPLRAKSGWIVALGVVYLSGTAFLQQTGGKLAAQVWLGR